MAQQNKNMKIFVITSTTYAGSVWHRLITPHAVLAKVFPDIHITFGTGISALSDNQIQEFQIMVCHQTYWDVGTIDRVRNLGVKVVYDLDDYWQLDTFMRSYEQWKHLNMKHLILNTASHCDLITCTTPILADSIKAELQNRVEVIPNGINADEDQWQPSPQASWEGVRFGYAGALEHLHDLRQIFGAQSSFDIYLTARLHELGIPAGFKQFPFRGLRDYARMYDDVDVCIAPLIASRFNRHKSELKMIEAGFKRKPIIVSEVEPFTLLITDKNCLRVGKARPWGWIKAMQMMSDSRSLREDLAGQLHEDVVGRYELGVLSVLRREIYDSL
jgi:hypothetical protein